MAPAIAFTLPAMQLMVNIVLPGSVGINNTHAASAWTANPLPLQTQYIILPEVGVKYGLNNTDTGPALHQPPTQNPPEMLPEGYVAHPDIGKAYKISTDCATWTSARERCIEEGGHLAVIDSNLKLACLLDLAGYINDVHVGIYRKNNDAEWISATTGLTLPNLPWRNSWPRNNLDWNFTHVQLRNRGLVNYIDNYVTYYACEIPIKSI